MPDDGYAAHIPDAVRRQSLIADQLARDAGINNIGSSGRGADDNSRAGLFDSASNDDDHDDADHAGM